MLIKQIYYRDWGLWHSFLFADVSKGPDILIWCNKNLGRRHRGLFLSNCDLLLSNWGYWRFDYATGGYPRVWLRKPEDITLFKVSWC